jgi:hypothetical protein
MGRFEVGESFQGAEVISLMLECRRGVRGFGHGHNTHVHHASTHWKCIPLPQMHPFIVNALFNTSTALVYSHTLSIHTEYKMHSCL